MHRSRAKSRPVKGDERLSSKAHSPQNGPMARCLHAEPTRRDAEPLPTFVLSGGVKRKRYGARVHGPSLRLNTLERSLVTAQTAQRTLVSQRCGLLVRSPPSATPEPKTPVCRASLAHPIPSTPRLIRITVRLPPLTIAIEDLRSSRRDLSFALEGRFAVGHGMSRLRTRRYEASFYSLQEIRRGSILQFCHLPGGRPVKIPRGLSSPCKNCLVIWFSPVIVMLAHV